MLDECMVTKRTLPTHDWSKLKINTRLDLSQIETAPIAIVGAISQEEGIELIMTFEKSVNRQKFKMFLEELSVKTQN